MVRHPRLSRARRRSVDLFPGHHRAKSAEETLRASTKRWKPRSPSARRNCRPRKRACGPIFETSFTYQGLMTVDGTLRRRERYVACRHWRQGSRRWSASRSGRRPGSPARPDMPETVRERDPRRRRRRDRAPRNSCQPARRGMALVRFPDATGPRRAGRGRRHRARSGRSHRAAASRGGAAPGAEDGRHRSAHRRRRARFQ